MSTKKLLGTLLLVVCVVGLTPLLSKPDSFSEPTDGLEPDHRSYSLAPGDLIFRRGHSLNSRAVLLADQSSPFSHVGLLARREGLWVVVHAAPGEEGAIGRVRAEPIDQFLSEAVTVDWAPYRLRGPLQREHGEAAARLALDMADQRLPFDDSFDLQDTSKLYCTELVWLAYREVGIDLVGNELDEVRLPLFNARVILPSRLLQHPMVERLSPSRTLDSLEGTS